MPSSGRFAARQSWPLPSPKDFWAVPAWPHPLHRCFPATSFTALQPAVAPAPAFTSAGDFHALPTVIKPQKQLFNCFSQMLARCSQCWEAGCFFFFLLLLFELLFVSGLFWVLRLNGLFMGSKLGGTEGQILPRSKPRWRLEASNPNPALCPNESINLGQNPKKGNYKKKR